MISLRFLRTIAEAESGQDLIEYAMMAGFIALAAGALMPGIATSISTVFTQVGSSLAVAAS
jgi:pilus assembly protein Flp/PilA